MKNSDHLGPQFIPVIPGSPDAPRQLEAHDLFMITFFKKSHPDGSIEPTNAASASDEDFDAWIRAIYANYLQNAEEREDHTWPIERRLVICNRLWQCNEIWGVKHIQVENSPEVAPLSEERT